MIPDPRQIQLFHHFRRVLEAAGERGIDIAPLKGAHLLTSVYPPDEDRGHLADVDFLVRERDWNRLRELMVELGFVEKPGGERPVTRVEFHETGFYLDAGGPQALLFEPHRQFAQPARHTIDYDEVWNRSVEGMFDSVPCRRLSAEDHLLHAVVHMFSHCFRKPTRGLRDIELLVRDGGIDLNLAIDRARQWQCARATWLALTLLQEIAPDLEIDGFAAKLAPPALVRQVLRFLVPDSAGFRFPPRGLRVEQAILWPWLMDRTRQGLRFATYYAGLRLRDLFCRARESIASYRPIR